MKTASPRIRMLAPTARLWISLLLAVSSCQAWILHPAQRPTRRHPLILFSSIAPLGTNEAAWKAEGERIIQQAAQEAGAKPEMIQIDWKSGRVIVTVDGSAYIPAELDFSDMEDDLEDEIDFDEEDDDDGMEFDMDDLDIQADLDEEDFNLLDAEPEEESLGVDVVSIARAVNAAFEAAGEGSIGYSIAVHHSIEVTTPGANDELTGIMYESYKGFDVILEFQDSKTGKTKKVEGKLIEKDEEFTRINERGRMRKFKNELVQSVKLPKAKTEKGNASKKSAPKKKSKKKRR